MDEIEHGQLYTFFHKKRNSLKFFFPYKHKLTNAAFWGGAFGVAVLMGLTDYHACTRYEQDMTKYEAGQLSTKPQRADYNPIYTLEKKVLGFFK